MWKEAGIRLGGGCARIGDRGGQLAAGRGRSIGASTKELFWDQLSPTTTKKHTVT
jgi:hypothetical protein